ncbi:TM0106 family RecB-like putative nuclease [Umezawaea sp.]|uniref:TM0106 family RecB-like putative nuclease n=1 Tax=Umezawaea sp. TaxID=1955258 RepID=UPI002ED22302
MTSQVQLDAGVVTRCRRRVHLENDPAMRDVVRAPADPAGEQRKADATEHRRQVASALAKVFGSELMEIPHGPEISTADRERVTLAAMRMGTPYIWGAALPRDLTGGRRGGIDLLVKDTTGYVPVLVVRHKTSDPGQGARTSPLSHPLPNGARVDPSRKVRPQPRDQLRLAHAQRQLQASGFAKHGRAVAGVIGMDADVVVWHDLEAATWPGGRTALSEYDARFSDRLAVAGAADRGDEPLAKPSRIVECKSCPWWPICDDELKSTRDVSLVARGEDAVALRKVGVTTVDQLAELSIGGKPLLQLVGMPFDDAVILARAWLRDLTVVRRSKSFTVPRADVEVDVDMESFGDLGAYMWGCWLSGENVDEEPGYRAFATWDPVPSDDEARSFAEFWTWLTAVRLRARARGLSFRAYCYNELAENRWLLGSAERFKGMPGIPPVSAVREFIKSDAWVDLFGIVREEFLCAHGKGLKTIAPVAGFRWRDPEAGGENSMRWYRDAVGMDGLPPDDVQRRRLVEYNEDDVRATHALRHWMSSEEINELPFAGDL